VTSEVDRPAPSGDAKQFSAFADIIPGIERGALDPPFAIPNLYLRRPLTVSCWAKVKV
jgi:hypothetical protein